MFACVASLFRATTNFQLPRYEIYFVVPIDEVASLTKQKDCLFKSPFKVRISK